MIWKSLTTAALMGSLALGPIVGVGVGGCADLPGDEKSQGAVIGGVGGALAGAAVAGKEDRLIGALLGGALGAGGGYLIGMQVDKNNDNKDTAKKREDAVAAAKKAEADPATAHQALKAKTADLNTDGFVTLDEVVAMEKAGITDKDMIRRLTRTQQYFELTETQETFLRDRGVSEKVVVAMRDMNRETASADLSEDGTGSQAVGRDAR